MNILKTGALSTSDFIEQNLHLTEKRLKSLGLSRDALLDPEDSFDMQVAILRHSYLLAERSAMPFNPGDDNFWRMLRARLQPMILAYLTHEKFVRSQVDGALERRMQELMEVYRDRVATTEQFRELFFQLRDEAVERGLMLETAGADGGAGSSELLEPHDRSHYDGSEGIADIQANVINQLKESLKEQERAEKRLKRQLKEQEDQLSRQEKIIEKLEEKQNQLLKENDRLSTENLQLKIAIDASQKVAPDAVDSASALMDSLAEEVDVAAPVTEQSLTLSSEDLEKASKEELILKIESLERDINNTSRAAYGAFMANSDLGVVVLFILSAFKCTSVNRLALEVGRSLKTYGMNSVFRVKSESSVDFFSEDSVTGKDKMLFRTHEGEGRFVDLGRSYLIYDDLTAVLVKNMPVDDEERMGRLKDNLNTLMQGAETCANLIKLSQSAATQKQRMEGLLVRSNTVFNKLASNLERNKQTSIAIMSKTSNDLRKQMNIAPGSPGNMRLSGVMRQMEASMHPLFALEKLVDAAFIKNVAKVVEAMKKENR